MDMPQLSWIDAHARVSAVSRSEEAHGYVSREFAALMVGEEAARRRHRTADDEPVADFASPPLAASPEPAETVIEPESLADADEILPEDAHDPQELCAILAPPTGDT